MLCSPPDVLEYSIAERPDCGEMRAVAVCIHKLGGLNINYILTAATQYATNHIVNSIPSYTVRHAWYRHVLGWELGQDTSIGLHQTIQMNSIRASGRRVSIDQGTVISTGCFISSPGGLVIGRHVSLSPGVWLVAGIRDADDPAFRVHYLPIVIDDFACIGARAIILGGVTIGTGAIVHAGAVVEQDVEPFKVVEGVPARVIGTRNLQHPSYHPSHGPLFG